MQIPMDKAFIYKENCMKKAKELYKLETLNMSVTDIAKEIYAHAILFYKANNSRIKTMFHKYIIKHCETIDLEVGGDAKHRQVVYNMIWGLDINEDKVAKSV